MEAIGTMCLKYDTISAPFWVELGDSDDEADEKNLSGIERLMRRFEYERQIYNRKKFFV